MDENTILGITTKLWIITHETKTEVGNFTKTSDITKVRRKPNWNTVVQPENDLLNPKSNQIAKFRHFFGLQIPTISGLLRLMAQIQPKSFKNRKYLYTVGDRE